MQGMGQIRGCARRLCQLGSCSRQRLSATGQWPLATGPVLVAQPLPPAAFLQPNVGPRLHQTSAKRILTNQRRPGARL